MKNPIKTTAEKVTFRRTSKIAHYKAELFGVYAIGKTKQEAEENLITLLKKLLRRSATPTFIQVGEYSSLMWMENFSGRWVYAFQDTPEGKRRALNAICSGYETQEECTQKAIWHMASLQSNLELRTSPCVRVGNLTPMTLQESLPIKLMKDLVDLRRLDSEQATEKLADFQIQVGDRVKVFQGDKFEGLATVKEIERQDDRGCLAQVLFDDDDPNDTYPRWIMLEHVERYLSDAIGKIVGN